MTLLVRGTCPLPYIKVGMKIQKTKRSVIWRVEDIVPTGPDYNEMAAILVSNSNICKLYCENILNWSLVTDYDPQEYPDEKTWTTDKK